MPPSHSLFEKNQTEEWLAVLDKADLAELLEKRKAKIPSGCTKPEMISLLMIQDDPVYLDDLRMEFVEAICKLENTKPAKTKTDIISDLGKFAKSLASETAGIVQIVEKEKGKEEKDRTGIFRIPGQTMLQTSKGIEDLESLKKGLMVSSLRICLRLKSLQPKYRL